MEYSDEDDYEYAYSDEDDDNVNDNDEKQSQDDDDDESEMEWEESQQPEENPNAAPYCKPRSGITMLPSDQLVPEMKRRLKDVMEILDVPECAAVVLLREHKWSQEVLLERWYNNPTKLQQACGVLGRCSSNKKSSRKSTNLCEICYEDDQPMLGMPCGHEFCTSCWKDFCSVMLQEGPACVRTTCPQASCVEVVTEVELQAALPEALGKFENYQLRSFVESNALTRWCPGRGCEQVACAAHASTLETESIAHCTKCDTEFCIVCGEEPHAPCSCKELAVWNEKCRNESETANWILANTKPCPKCSSRIEKNQGCNHMTCQRCRHEFCWICSGDWKDHGANTGGYYKCNKFDAGGNADDQSDAARAKRELDRYLHYYKRYHAHAEAQAFAKKQLRETEQRMVLLQESNSDAKWTDVEFLKTANEQLVECRRVLKYTYTFAYYLTDDTKSMQKERFEHHQEMLERFTENLSELSEKPLAEMDRTDVVNQTRVVDRFMKNILKYVEDGMEDTLGGGV